MKKLLALILIATLALSVTVLPAMAYTDVAGTWGEQAINQWGSTLVPSTTGKYEPNTAVTRAEFAHVVQTLAKYPAATATFTDIAGNPYAADIGALQKAGVVNGTVEGKIFDPNAPLTRQAAAKMLGIAFGLPVSASKTTYSDDASIAVWAKPYVESLKTFSYLTGVGDNRYGPLSSLTRAEIAQIAFNVNPGTYAKNANYVVTTAGTIKDQTFNNLIIAPSVTGNVTLENVVVNGSLIVLGATGPAKSANYSASAVSAKAETLAAGKTVATENYANPVAAFGLNITGTSNIGQLFVQKIADVTINAKVGSVVVQQSVVTLVVGSAGTVTTLITTSVSTSVVITNNGTITTLYTYASETTITNNGVITTAYHLASVTIVGTAPATDSVLEPGSVNNIYG